MSRTLTLALLLTTAGCGMAGIGGLEKYDGRWVANVRPRGDCAPVRVQIDVDGHNVTGTVEDRDSVLAIKGRVDEHGTATLTVDGKPTTLHFSGDIFTTVLPTDPCARQVTGNRGG